MVRAPCPTVLLAFSQFGAMDEKIGLLEKSYSRILK